MRVIETEHADDDLSVADEWLMNVPFVSLATPGWPVVPMSALVHGLGTVGVAATVKDHTGPAVVPTLLRATTCQKKVRDGASVAGADI
jgi:hypothetical protein